MAAVWVVAWAEVVAVAGSICVLATAPSENATLSDTFCQSPFLGIADENGDVVWVENPFAEVDGASSMFVKFLLDKGIDCVIAGSSPGAGVAPILSSAGVKVYVVKGSVADAIDKYKKGALHTYKGDGTPKGDCKGGER